MSQIEQLHQQRAELVEKKRATTERLIAIKRRLEVTLPKPTYTAVRAERDSLVHDLVMIESQLTQINANRHAAQEADTKAIGLQSVPHFKELVGMRDHYQEFAADPTRSPMARRMAAEFVVKLTPIIRKGINHTGSQ